MFYLASGILTLLSNKYNTVAVQSIKVLCDLHLHVIIYPYHVTEILNLESSHSDSINVDIAYVKVHILENAEDMFN